MTPSEAVQAVRQRLVPELEYALKTISLDKKKFKKYTMALRKNVCSTNGPQPELPGSGAACTGNILRYDS